MPSPRVVFCKKKNRVGSGKNCRCGQCLQSILVLLSAQRRESIMLKPCGSATPQPRPPSCALPSGQRAAADVGVALIISGLELCVLVHSLTCTRPIAVHQRTISISCDTPVSRPSEPPPPTIHLFETGVSETTTRLPLENLTPAHQLSAVFARLPTTSMDCVDNHEFAELVAQI